MLPVAGVRCKHPCRNGAACRKADTEPPGLDRKIGTNVYLYEGMCVFKRQPLLVTA